MFEGEQPLFNFVVPDELLAAAVSKSRDKAAVADVALMPGTGEGKPPPLLGILREHGFAPLVLLTVAAMVTDTIVNGIGILGPEIKRSFHLSDTGLGAVIFVGAVAQIAVGGCRWRSSPTGAAARRWPAITLLIFSATVPLMALVHNVWPFVFLYLVAAIGLGSSDTVHNAYLADAYPTHGRGPHLHLAQHERPGVADHRDPPRGLHRVGDPQLAVGPGAGGHRRARRHRHLLHPGAREGGERVEPHPQERPAWTSRPSRRTRPRCSSARP